MSFMRALAGGRDASRALVNGRTGVVVAHDVEAAVTSRARRRGLLGRDAMHDGQALILAPCGAIHTCGMRFPIDVLFVARDGRVLKIVERLAAWRIAGSLRAIATVELPAGHVERVGLAAGDRLIVCSLASRTAGRT